MAGGLTVGSLTMTDEQQSILDLLATSNGAAVVDMGNADYTLTESEARYGTIVIANAGSGANTLTIPSFDTNSNRYGIFLASGGPIKIVAADDTSLISTCYSQVDVAYAFGVGAVGLYNSQTIISSASSVNTTGNTNEQIIRSHVLPLSGLQDGEFLEVAFSAKKSSTATTETFRLRFGTPGTTADTQIWTNSAMATTTDNIAAMVRIFRISATSVIAQTITNALSPYGSSATDFAAITVSNMDSNAMYLSLTGQNDTGAETVSNLTYLLRTGQ